MATPSWFRRADRAALSSLLFLGLSVFFLVMCPGGQLQAQEAEPAAESPPLGEPAPTAPARSRDLFADLFRPMEKPLPVTRPRSFLTRIEVRQVYDDAIRTRNGEEVAGTYTLIAPVLRLVQNDARDQWALEYRLGARVYPRFSDQNSLAHDAALLWNHLWSERLSLGVRAGYQAHPGGVLEELSAGAGSSALGGSDVSVNFLFQKQINRELQFSVDYLLGPRGQLTVGGEYASRSSAGLPVPTNRAASIFLVQQQRLSREHALGGAYQVQSFSYGGHQERTLVHNVLLLYSYQFGPSMSLAVFGGPAWVESQRPASPAVSSERRGFGRWTGGVTLTKARGRTFFHARYAEFFAPGAGLLPTVRRQAMELYVARDFGQSLRLGAEVDCSRNQALDGERGFRSCALQPVLRYRLQRQWFLVAEPRIGRLWGLGGSRRSRRAVTVGFEYEFPKVLSR